MKMKVHEGPILEDFQRFMFKKWAVRLLAMPFQRTFMSESQDNCRKLLVFE